MNSPKLPRGQSWPALLEPIALPAKSTTLPIDVWAFNRELFRQGVQVMACGGGVVPEPRTAILNLEERYGADGLRQQCLKIAGLPREQRARLTEGVLPTAHGVLFHLGDAVALAELLIQHRSEASTAQPAETKKFRHSLWARETLIAGLAHKLGCALPEGIRPLVEWDWLEFYADSDPMTDGDYLSLVLIFVAGVYLVVGAAVLFARWI